MELARERDPFAVEAVERFGHPVEREEADVEGLERMRRARAAVEPAIEEYRVQMAHRRADLEAVDDADETLRGYEEAGLLADFAGDVLGGRLAHVAEAGGIPPATSGPLDEQDFVALVEDDRATSDAR